MYRAVVVLAITLLIGGCRASEGSPPGATVPTVPSTSTTAPIDVAVIPPVIDEPYLNAVLAALDEVDGEATRLTYAQKKLTPEAVDLLNAIYSDDQTDRQAAIWLVEIVGDPEMKGIITDPRGRTTRVDRLISASSRCVFMAARRDYSQVAVNSTPGPLEYLVLRPLDRSNDPAGRNRTAWMITADGYRADQAGPSDPCGR